MWLKQVTILRQQRCEKMIGGICRQHARSPWPIGGGAQQSLSRQFPDVRY
jgi:hypothetical protein